MHSTNGGGRDMAPRNGSGILEPISARNELDRLMVHIESTLLFVMVLLVVWHFDRLSVCCFLCRQFDYTFGSVRRQLIDKLIYIVNNCRRPIE